MTVEEEEAVEGVTERDRTRDVEAERPTEGLLQTDVGSRYLLLEIMAEDEKPAGGETDRDEAVHRGTCLPESLDDTLLSGRG